VVILAIGIIQRSAAQAAQGESAVEPALLDKPLIFDSSTRGPGGTKISPVRRMDCQSAASHC